MFFGCKNKSFPENGKQHRNKITVLCDKSLQNKIVYLQIIIKHLFNGSKIDEMVKLVCKIVGFFLLLGILLAWLNTVTPKAILGWCGQVGEVIAETMLGFLPDWMVPDAEEEEKEEENEDEEKEEEEEEEKEEEENRENIRRIIHYYIVTVDEIGVSVKAQKQKMAGLQETTNQAIASGNARVLQQSYSEMNQTQVQIGELLTQVNNLQNNLYNVKNTTNATNTTNNLTQVDINNINNTLETVNNLKVELNDLHTETQNYITKIQKVLQVQEQEENKKYHYAIGPKEKLLKSGIISEGLFGRLSVKESGYNSSLYIPGKASDLTHIELHAKKAEILSDMPSGSYELHDVNSYLILVVTDEKKFWSKTDYLVVVTE